MPQSTAQAPDGEQPRASGGGQGAGRLLQNRLELVEDLWQAGEGTNFLSSLPLETFEHPMPSFFFAMVRLPLGPIQTCLGGDSLLPHPLLPRSGTTVGPPSWTRMSLDISVHIIIPIMLSKKFNENAVTRLPGAVPQPFTFNCFLLQLF